MVNQKANALSRIPYATDEVLIVQTWAKVIEIQENVVIRSPNMSKDQILWRTQLNCLENID